MFMCNGPLKAGPDIFLASTADSSGTDIESFRNLLIFEAFVCFEQDAGTAIFASRRLALADQISGLPLAQF